MIFHNHDYHILLLLFSLLSLLLITVAVFVFSFDFLILGSIYFSAKWHHELPWKRLWMRENRCAFRWLVRMTPDYMFQSTIVWLFFFFLNNRVNTIILIWNHGTRFLLSLYLVNPEQEEVSVSEQIRAKTAIDQGYLVSNFRILTPCDSNYTYP